MSKLTMRELSKLPENLICADCATRDPDWASINLGIFICIKCAGVHRNLGVHISKVRSLDLDTACWDDEMIAHMRANGNVLSRAAFEKNAPKFHIRPAETDSSLVRETWIRSKYEKKLFLGAGAGAGAGGAQRDDEAGVFMMPEAVREGFMWKESGGAEGKFQRRWFSLLGNRVSYYKDPGDAEAVKWFEVNGCTVTVPDAVEAARKFTFDINTPDRTYQVYTESEREMFDWIHSLRRAGLYYGKMGHTFASQNAAPPHFGDHSLSRARLVGELEKCDGGFFSYNNTRWFVLTDDALYLFKSQPQRGDEPESGISLTYTTCTDAKVKGKKPHTFCISTLDINYFYQAPNDKEMWKWITAIGEVINVCTPRESVDFKLVPYP